ncbi:MFS transporter [Catenuloplanes sp. NPDC051500]|uniref:MFS transporter n=1 Tax=Catenuloplanes sp. NPDC051500 TaxID=3363959 RepID=UPI0037B8A1A7
MTTTAQPDIPAHAPTAHRSLRDVWIALAGLSAVFLFEMLDNSILNVALPTIGRDLQASASGLQWVTGAYSLVFGGAMLLFGAIADRFGRRRVMLTGLVLLAATSCATVLVTSAGQLIAIRAVMGLAAAMTTPGSMALAFRLFDTDDLRVRALTVISTAGLVGLALGPTAGGFLLAVTGWQALLLINVPIAALAFIGIRLGVGADTASGLHRDPIDVTGAVLGTATIVLALLAPTLFVAQGGHSLAPWSVTAGAIVAAVVFTWRERTAHHPLLDLALVTRPMVSSGLAYKAAAGLAVAGLSYLVTLQLQFAWGWSPAAAALGMLPQVVVLLAGGRLVGPFVTRAGLQRAAWLSAVAVVSGLAVFGALSRFGYPWIVVALVLVAAGMRVVGAVAGNNVLQGLPPNRTSMGAALVDTSSELASGIGIAVTGTILAALFTGSLTAPAWNTAQSTQFQDAVQIAGLTLTVVAAALVGFGILRSRQVPTDPQAPTAAQHAATPSA